MGTGGSFEDKTSKSRLEASSLSALEPLADLHETTLRSRRIYGNLFELNFHYLA